MCTAAGRQVIPRWHDVRVPEAGTLHAKGRDGEAEAGDFDSRHHRCVGKAAVVPPLSTVFQTPAALYRVYKSITSTTRHAVALDSSRLNPEAHTIG